jgi:hypothetical protein
MGPDSLARNDDEFYQIRNTGYCRSRTGIRFFFDPCIGDRLFYGFRILYPYFLELNDNFLSKNIKKCKKKICEICGYKKRKDH